jgi:hypothetical protein
MATLAGCARCIVALLAIVFARAASAQEDASARLFGSWRLISAFVVPDTASKPRPNRARSHAVGGNSPELFRDCVRLSAFAAISPPGFYPAETSISS